MDEGVGQRGDNLPDQKQPIISSGVHLSQLKQQRRDCEIKTVEMNIIFVTNSPSRANVTS